jgi:hypothetical protein
MKKYLVIWLTIIMIGSLTATVSAAAIGVNVAPGFVAELGGQFTPAGNDFCPAFYAGLNNKVALGVMYDSSFNYFTVLGRYVIVTNVAANLLYRLDGSNGWMVDLRGKYFLNQSLALAGKYGYDSLSSGSAVIGQVEYLVNDHWLGNAGLSYAYSTTFLVLGAEFFTGNIDIGVDCAFPAHDFSKPVIAVVVDYLLKK